MKMIRSITLGALLLSFSACATPPPEKQDDACAIYAQNKSWYRITAKTERKWGTPKELQLAFIKKESSFDRKAKPQRKKFLFILPGKRLSSAKGYAQALDGTWELYKKHTGNKDASRKNFADASDFIGWYTSQTARRTGMSKSDAYHQYIAYHEGAGGYLKGKWKSKPDVKRRARVVANQTKKYEEQLRYCEGRFKRNIPFIPFI